MPATLPHHAAAYNAVQNHSMSRGPAPAWQDNTVIRLPSPFGKSCGLGQMTSDATVAMEPKLRKDNEQSNAVQHAWWQSP